jgi:hypothetical protein
VLFPHTLAVSTRWHCTALVRRAPAHSARSTSPLLRRRLAAVRKRMGVALLTGAVTWSWVRLRPAFDARRRGVAVRAGIPMTARRHSHSLQQHNCTIHFHATYHRHGNKVRQTSVLCFVMYKTSSHQSYTPNLAARHCLERQNTVLQRLQLRPAMRAFFCHQTLLAGPSWPAVPVWIGSLWLL